MASALVLVLVAASIACGGGGIAEREAPQGLPGVRPTSPGLRVAFLGDQGLNDNSERVLELVAREGADMLVILGDFDYEGEVEAWEELLDGVLGRDYPVFAVVGNHDTGDWAAYQERLIQRLTRVEGASCQGDFGVNAACSYQGLFFVLSGVGTLGSGHEGFMADALAEDDSIWRVCAWHKNQKAMQVGGKEDEVGWEAYETCRERGAIIATAHEHSYERTTTLIDMGKQTVDPAWPNPQALRISDGSTFAFVSGLGGRDIRDQERCGPEEPPYGCNGVWASVYTEDQGATYGALFLDFNVQGDPRKATGYFKNIDGAIIDQFSIVSAR